MAALAADRVTRYKGPSIARRQAYLMKASTTIYKGGMVCLDANRLAVPAADTAGLTDVVGIATAQQISAASGSTYVVVEQGKFLLDAGASLSSIAIALESNAYVTDDQTVCIGGSATNKVRVGRILEWLDETQDKVWVDVGNPRPPRIFISAEITGNGGAQNTAHGLGVIPVGVAIMMTVVDGNAVAITEGSHTATNAIFTVTSGDKYKVFAYA